MLIAPPKQSHELPLGSQLNAGLGISEVVADFDFETYSGAGFEWNEIEKKYFCLEGVSKKGLPAVGAYIYTDHPSAEVLCLSYNLKNGNGIQLWTPYDHPPIDLFVYLNEGGLIEAWNVNFEYYVWTNICIKKYGWPPLNIKNLRCAAAKSRAFALPGRLVDAGDVLNIINKKDKEGTRLLNKFSIPRDPTKNNLSQRTELYDDMDEALKLFDYCKRDIEAEAEISSFVPDLCGTELEFWQSDHAINLRGVCVDTDLINACIKIVDQCMEKYTKELSVITGGEVNSVFEIARFIAWLNKNEVPIQSLEKDGLLEIIVNSDNINPYIRRAMQIRLMLCSASIKKLYSMRVQTARDGRIHDLFMYHSARTGRAAGNGPQPQNLPNSGPDVHWCNTCHDVFDTGHEECKHCGQSNKSIKKWGPQTIEKIIPILKDENLELIEQDFKDPFKIISGCLRSMFISAPGHDLISSDYSAIEAVVLAQLAGEQWRIDVFKTHGKIYEMSAAQITGISFEEICEYKNKNGDHHPARKIGKIAELASGYQGWIGAWNNFNADDFLNEDEIKNSILTWRKASPKIVEFWGGQQRNFKKELYGIEGAALCAALDPGTEHVYNGIKYLVKQNKLYCTLLSGRILTYHRPEISIDNSDNFRRGKYILSFEGWNTNPLNGRIGWIRMNTYGGKLVENIVQATARDILAYAIINLEKSGYPVVLHVHDEIVSEIPEKWGSIEGFEEIMSTMPEWAKDWRINARGGWRAKRYQK